MSTRAVGSGNGWEGLALVARALPEIEGLAFVALALRVIEGLALVARALRGMEGLAFVARALPAPVDGAPPFRGDRDKYL